MRRFLPFVPALVLLASPALAGWTMTQVISSSGGHGAGAGDMTQKLWADGSSAKIEFEATDNPILKKGTYLLMQDGGAKVFLVNPAEKTYSRFDLDAMGAGLDAMAGSGFEMKIENPKMEKLSEEKGETMLGYPTTHYRYHTTYTVSISMPMGMKTSMATDSTEDVWTTTAIDLGTLGKSMSKLGGGAMMKEISKLSEMEKSKATGLPLKRVVVSLTKSTGTGMMAKMMGGGGDSATTVTTEVKEAAETSVPAATFQIPAGYTETEMMQRGPGMPNMNEGRPKPPGR
ncbi:MAG: hypothetical protein ABI609_11750 [Acidobacteriota bacterium]